MIPESHQPLLAWLLDHYMRHQLRSRFQGLYVTGLQHLHTLPIDRSVIAYANHCGWWDLFWTYRLSRECPQKKIYGMMEEKQLRPYRFFTALGTFSIDLSAPGKASAGLRHALRLLQKPASMVWMFPEGELRSPTLPFAPRPGLQFLCRKKGTTVLLPIALRYEFFRDDKPVALAAIGPSFPASEADEPRIIAQQQALSDHLAATTRTRDLSDFTCLQEPRLTINKRWEWLCCALRGRLHTFQPHN
jgi:hypothetical protein